jgi:hypothetical protein
MFVPSATSVLAENRPEIGARHSLIRTTPKWTTPIAGFVSASITPNALAMPPGSYFVFHNIRKKIREIVE